jgi:hypothetical protein
MFASDKRGQEFDVERTLLITEPVVRGWRLMFAQEALFETRAR